MAEFSFDEDALHKVVKDTIDGLWERYQGRPLDEVTKACKDAGLDSPEIAQAISDGVRPDVQRG